MADRPRRQLRPLTRDHWLTPRLPISALLHHYVQIGLLMKHLSLLLLFFLTQPALGQRPARLDSLVPAWLDSAGVPGLSMALINEKGVTSLRSYGVRERGKPAPIDSGTVFSAASLSKPVFAYLVLKLAHEGKIDLDKPLHQYVPYRAIEHDQRYRPITARMVLSHQTGFPNWRTGRLDLLFVPGKRFSYSGEGFVYLQGVVMTIMGKPIEDLARQYVFEPLGMRRSSYRWQGLFDANHATPHDRFGSPTPLTRFEEENVAYSLQTTAADYGRFLVALLTGEGLNPVAWQAMMSPQVTTGLTLRDTTRQSALIRWGLGVGLQQQGGETGFWHWGDNGDVRCFAYVSLARKQGVVYFTNGRNGLSLLSVLVQHTLGVSATDIADFLQYDAYQRPPVQVSRNLLKKGVSEAVGPFLALDRGGKPRSKATRLAETDLLEIADELSRGPHGDKSIALLALGSRAYPQSAKLLKAYAISCLKQGKRDESKAILTRYLTQKPADETARQLLGQLTAPPSGNVTLRLRGFPMARLITLAGSFNDWQPVHTLFNKVGSEWHCTLRLPRGTYPYKIVVDGNWHTDPGNPTSQTDPSGNMNSVLTVKND